MSEIITVNLDDIRLNDYNPNSMDIETYTVLLKDMRQVGPDGIDPILIRPIGDEIPFEAVDGEHRIRAAVELGWKEIRARVQKLSLEEAMEVNYRKNRERGTLDPVKEGELFLRLEDRGLNRQQLAIKFGVTETFVKDRIKIVENLSKKAIDTMRSPSTIPSDSFVSTYLQPSLKLSPSKMVELSRLDEGFLQTKRVSEERLPYYRKRIEEAQVEVAKKIRGRKVKVKEAKEIAKEKLNEITLEWELERSAGERLEKRRVLEEGGYVVVLEEERDWLKHRNMPRTEDGVLADRCVTCPRPALLLKRNSLNTEEICADGPCWLKTSNEVYEEKRRRRKEEERRLLEQQAKVLGAGDEVLFKIALFNLSLSHRPGYLAEDNFFDRWRPVEQMTPGEAKDWFFRSLVEAFVLPVKAGDRVDTRQMKKSLVDRCGLDMEYIFPKEEA